MSETKEVERRVAIADAAILVLAEEGARGLTHRAIDRRLSLPTGSTSYYFRTRAALLSCTAERLVALDMADVEALTDGPSEVVQLLAHWTAAAQHARLVARFQLFVEAARDPEIHELLKEPRKAFIAHAARRLHERGVREPKLAALLLVAAVDGLLLNELIGEHLSPERLRRTLGPLRRILTPKA